MIFSGHRTVYQYLSVANRKCPVTRPSNVTASKASAGTWKLKSTKECTRIATRPRVAPKKNDDLLLRLVVKSFCDRCTYFQLRNTFQKKITHTAATSTKPTIPQSASVLM